MAWPGNLQNEKYFFSICLVGSIFFTSGNSENEAGDVEDDFFPMGARRTQVCKPLARIEDCSTEPEQLDCRTRSAFSQRRTTETTQRRPLDDVWRID